MGGHDDEVGQEFVDLRRRLAVEAALDDVAALPILLALPALAP
jgi:hypothetical protein